MLSAQRKYFLHLTNSFNSQVTHTAELHFCVVFVTDEHGPYAVTNIYCIFYL